jgi:hypothetical protein
MATLLDYRSSQNSNTNADTPGTPIGATPVFIGDIGLIVGTAQNIRVNLWATVGLDRDTAIDGTSEVKFLIARNLNPTNVFNAANVIFTANQDVEPQVGTTNDDQEIVTLNVADLGPTPGPIAGQINYSLFAQVIAGPNIRRNGPENLSGMAVID